jgi:predicted acyl esterase
VRLEVRERHGVAEEREENDYPLARIQYRRLFLGAAKGSLTQTPGTAAELRQDAIDGTSTFDIRFDEETEITGHASLRLWVEAEGSDDADLFVALQKLDAKGEEVGFTFYAFFENGPIALGWLRASHRALDPELSTPEQPVHSHRFEERLSPGECVPVEIEIWPFSARFAPGESLRLVVGGADIYKKEEGLMLPFALHEDTRNRGTHIIRTGGEYDSSLLLPFVPPKKE